jgi:hypothetical protein
MWYWWLVSESLLNYKEEEVEWEPDPGGLWLNIHREISDEPKHCNTLPAVRCRLLQSVTKNLTARQFRYNTAVDCAIRNNTEAFLLNKIGTCLEQRRDVVCRIWGYHGLVNEPDANFLIVWQAPPRRTFTTRTITPGQSTFYLEIT